MDIQCLCNTEWKLLPLEGQEAEEICQLLKCGCSWQVPREDGLEWENLFILYYCYPCCSFVSKYLSMNIYIKTRQFFNVVFLHFCQKTVINHFLGSPCYPCLNQQLFYPPVYCHIVCIIGLYLKGSKILYEAGEQELQVNPVFLSNGDHLVWQLISKSKFLR